MKLHRVIRHPARIMLILAIVTVILAIISLGLGRFSIAAPQVIGMMFDKFLPFVHVEQAWTTQQAALFLGCAYHVSFSFLW